MTDEAALLYTIRDMPDDDTPRLVYADYVEGRDGPGDTEFAEFIRVQIEFARHPHANDILSADYDARDGISDLWQRGFNLQSRERELWPAVRGRFEGAGYFAVSGFPVQDYHDPATLPLVLIRRGLPAEVRGPLAAMVGDGRTPGIVAELRRSWPVVRAVAVDKKPLEFDGRFLWHNAEHRLTSSEHDNDTRPPDHLPAELFNRLSGFIPRDAPVTDAVRGWPTEPAAFNALSTAIIAMADGQIAKGVEHATR